MLQESLKYSIDALLSLSAWNYIFIIGFLMYINWRRTPHPKFPPGPKGVPLLGVLPFLSEEPARDFKKWSLKYGPIMSVRFGTTSMVILNDFKTVNQALIKQGNTFSGRPRVDLFCNMTKRNGILFKNYGEDFKAQKHFALKYLREHGLAKQKMESMIINESELFVKHLEELQNRDNQVDLRGKLYQATSNAISQTIFGTRSEYGDPSFIKLLHTLKMLFGDPKYATRLGILFIFNITELPYFSAAMKAFRKNMEYILGKMQELIDEHKINFDPNNIGDYIDAFLFEQQKGNQPKEGGFTDDQLRTICRDFLMAGSETTSNLISWLFVIYMNFPHYQKLINDEINNVLGFSGIPTMAKRAEMPFTCAFIEEGMRYRIVSPLGPHLTTTEVKLEGFVIPKGTKVFANVQGIHTDPDDWPNPEQFDPYRHIDNNGQFVNSKKVIPFGIGSRFCLGESLARVEVFIFFVKILQKFHVRSAHDYLPPLDNPVPSAAISPRECVVKLTVNS